MGPGSYGCPYQDRPPTPRRPACPVCPRLTPEERDPIMQTHTDAMAAGLGGWKKSLSVRVWDTIMMVTLLYKSEVTVKWAYETEHFD
ncbi:hypothetical protein FOVG_13490 [Fusarium oxysporum f. sp. pisi HDV247]|uniref:Uncharacterized protein n=1 Tax=Fusarium oxysporum f. sp. pisi HDV247 TaxID=1080344 RepID=W9NRE7_FUSOX|nr:hypothetical protein FOVG_13490 [Fusarium oxysporum f. sp. pisi HDV247]